MKRADVFEIGNINDVEMEERCGDGRTMWRCEDEGLGWEAVFTALEKTN